MLQRTSVWILVAALLSAGVPAFAASAKTRQAEGTGRVTGVAKDASGQILPNRIARLRNVDNGQIVGETTTNVRGEFAFTGLNPGRYVVEIVSDRGDIIGTTSAISLTVGSMVASGVTVTATAAAIGGAAAGAAAAAAGGGFFSSTAGIIVLAAAGAGIAGTAAVVANASASR